MSCDFLWIKLLKTKRPLKVKMKKKRNIHYRIGGCCFFFTKYNYFKTKDNYIGTFIKAEKIYELFK